MLDRIMKRPQVTSSDEWLFQGSNQVAQNQKAHHFYPTFHYEADNDTLRYSQQRIRTTDAKNF